MQKPKTMTVLNLKPIVTYLFDDVRTIYYMIDQNKEELVMVVFKPGSKTFERFGGREFQICVTADSNEALVKDVLEGLYRLFC